MKIICIIPARYQSTRLPGKPLLDIDGKPMIIRVMERVRLVDEVSEIIVATDDKRIFEVVEQFGGKAVMTSESHRSGTDRLAEVIRQMPDKDVVINVQGDEPLIEPAAIKQLIEVFVREKNENMATLAVPMRAGDYENPSAVKVVTSLNGYALYFSRSLIPYPRTADERVHVLKHVGIYAYSREFLLKFSQLTATPLETTESLEQLRALEHGYQIRVAVNDYESIGVDTPQELEAVRRIFAERKEERA